MKKSHDSPQLMSQLLITSAPLTSPSDLTEYLHATWPELRTGDVTWFPEDPITALSIEVVRQLQTHLQYTTLNSTQIIVLPNLDQASLPAQQALLKILEEPPAHTQLLLTASRVSLIPATILSRCQLKQLSTGQVTSTSADSELYQQLTTGNVPEILELAARYSKKEPALQVITDLLNYLHQQNSHQPLPSLTLHLHTLLEAYELIWTNHSPRLTLEHLWLNWHRSR